MGTVYRFRVDGVDADTGTINLHLNDVQPPPNDNFANAIGVARASTKGRTNPARPLRPASP